ncbi:NEAT domain-containing protein [Paenibacillus sp. y28]|uniref:NEAT domain-containing protein n=1 Tax=Paenibacillus sp. y28 TaxID=3129110 RepID=UPI0030191FAE
MGTRLKKWLSAFMMVCVLLSTIQIPFVSAADTWDDGLYSIDYRVYKDGTTEGSVMETYSVRRAVLEVKNGQTYIYTYLDNSDWTKSLQTDTSANGTKVYQDTERVIPDTKLATITSGSVPYDWNGRIDKFLVPDLSKKLNSYMHIKIPDGVLPFEYDNYYTVQYAFDLTSVLPLNTGLALNDAISQAKTRYDSTATGTTGGTFLKATRTGLNSAITFAQVIAANSSITPEQTAVTSYIVQAALKYYNDSEIKPVSRTGLTAKIGEAQTVFNTTAEGTLNGQYSTASRSALQTAITTAKAVEANNDASPQEVIDAEAALQAALTVYLASVITFSLSDGVYSIDFTALDSTKEKASSMDSYLFKAAKLTANQGSKKVSFTVKDSDIVTGFKVKVNDEWISSTVLSTDVSTNTRVIEFPVTDSDLTDYTYAQVHISTVAGGTAYEKDHDIYLKFDTASIAKYIADGTYSFNFTAMHATKEQTSSMNSYFNKPGQLTVQQGKRIVTAVINNHTTVPIFKVEQNGVLTDTSVISIDTVANTRTVQFEVQDLDTPVNAMVHISTMANGSPYEMDHNLRLKFDSNLGQPIASAILTGPLNVSYGAQFKLNYKLTGVTDSVYENVYQHQFTVAYDPSKLTFSKAASVLTTGKLTVTTTEAVPGTVQVTAQSAADLTTNSRFIDLTFTAKSVTESTYAVVYLNDVYAISRPDNSLSFPNIAHSVNILVPVTKDALNTFIATAEAAYNNAVEGAAIGEYPAGAKATLQAAIQSAQTVASSSAATQAQVNQALTALQTAYAAFQASAIKPINPDDLQNGIYKINFSVLQNGTTKTSVMDSYTKHPAKLTVADGKYKIELTLTNSDWIKQLQVEKNGVLTDVDIVTADTVVGTAVSNGLTYNVYERAVSFDVDNLSSALNAYTHIKIPDGILPFPYDNSYQVQFQFDKSSIVWFDTSTPVNPGTVLDTGSYTFNLTSSDDTEALNTYLTGSGTIKAQNQKHIVTITAKSGVTITKLQKLNADNTTEDIYPLTTTAAKQNGWVQVLATDSTASTTSYQFELDDMASTYIVNTFVTKDNASEVHTFKIAFANIQASTTTNPGTGGSSSGGSGGSGGTATPVTKKYSINYKILKYGTTQSSVMQSYVVTPGVLRVEGSQKYLSFTLKQSKEITDFKVEQDGSLSAVSVVSEDEEKNTRVVEFPFPDLSATVNGWVKIDWPAMNYFHEYDIQIQVDESSMKLLSDGSSTKGGSGGTSVTINGKELVNGDYNMDFSILEHNNISKKSFLNDYMLHPARLTIRGGSNLYVSFMTNQGNQITDFKLEKNGKLTAPIAISHLNPDDNTQVYQFEVEDLEKKLEAQVRLQDGTTHDIQVTFDTSTIQVREGQQPDNGEPGPGTVSLTDIQDHWAKANIEKAVDLGIVNGYGDATFRPNDEVSRAEFTIMISRALRLNGDPADLSYDDLDSIPLWVQPYLQQAVSAGIIGSYEDNTFRSDRQISRAEIAAIIARALKLTTEANAGLSFADADDIPNWAKIYVVAAANTGLINGRDNNLFAPQANATRAEAVTLIVSMLNHIQAQQALADAQKAAEASTDEAPAADQQDNTETAQTDAE